MLSVRGLALTGGILWGGCVLLIGLANLTSPPYGAEFLAGRSFLRGGVSWDPRIDLSWVHEHGWFRSRHRRNVLCSARRYNCRGDIRLALQ